MTDTLNLTRAAQTRASQLMADSRNLDCRRTISDRGYSRRHSALRNPPRRRDSLPYRPTTQNFCSKGDGFLSLIALQETSNHKDRIPRTTVEHNQRFWVSRFGSSLFCLARLKGGDMHHNNFANHTESMI